MKSFLINIKHKKILLVAICFLMLFSTIMLYNVGINIQKQNEIYEQTTEKTQGFDFNYISLNNPNTTQDYLNELNRYEEEGIQLVKYVQNDILMNKNDLVSTDFYEYTQTDDPNFYTKENAKINSLGIDYNMYSRYSMEAKEGELLNKKDFNKYLEKDMVIPVLVGSDYKEYYKLGDEFKGQIYSYEIENPYDVLGSSTSLYGGVVENSSSSENETPGNLVEVTFQIKGFIKEDIEYPGYSSSLDGFETLNNKVVYPYYLKKDILNPKEQQKYLNQEYVYPDFSTALLVDKEKIEYKKVHEITNSLDEKYDNKMILENMTEEVYLELDIMDKITSQYKILFIISFTLLIITLVIISLKELKSRTNEYVIKIYLGSKKRVVFHQHTGFILFMFIISFIISLIYLIITKHSISIPIILIIIMLYITTIIMISFIMSIKFLKKSIYSLMGGSND